MELTEDNWCYDKPVVNVRTGDLGVIKGCNKTFGGLKFLVAEEHAPLSSAKWISQDDLQIQDND